MKHLDIILPSKYQNKFYKPSPFGWRMFVYRRIETFLNWYNRDCTFRKGWNRLSYWIECDLPKFKKSWREGEDKKRLLCHYFFNWAFHGPYHPYKITLWKTRVQGGQTLTTMFIMGMSKGKKAISASLRPKEHWIDGDGSWVLKKAPKGVSFTDKDIKAARCAYLRWRKSYQNEKIIVSK